MTPSSGKLLSEMSLSFRLFFLLVFLPFFSLLSSRRPLEKRNSPLSSETLERQSIRFFIVVVRHGNGNRRNRIRGSRLNNLSNSTFHTHTRVYIYICFVVYKLQIKFVLCRLLVWHRGPLPRLMLTRFGSRLIISWSSRWYIIHIALGASSGRGKSEFVSCAIDVLRCWFIKQTWLGILNWIRYNNNVAFATNFCFTNV